MTSLGTRTLPLSVIARNEVTWLSPIKKRGDCFAPLAMTSRGELPCTGMVSVHSRSDHEIHHRDFSQAASRLTRNYIQFWRTLPTLVIARNEVTWQSPLRIKKDLASRGLACEVPGFVGGEAEGSQSDIKKRGDCFAPLAMTLRGRSWLTARTAR